jgi:hypothetical protein
MSEVDGTGPIAVVPAAGNGCWAARIRAAPRKPNHELYGSAQMTGGAICSGVEWLARPGTVGLPGTASTEVVILDPDGRELPSGEVGEIFMYTGSARGFSVGDPGYLDSDGYLYPTDRTVDVFTAGGANPEHPPGEAALKEFCRGRLPAFKVPVTIAVVNELARSR